MRLFFSVGLGPAAAARLQEASQDLARSGGDVRWASPGSSHLTLAFLGEQPPDAAARAIRAARAVPPLSGTASLGPLGAFPDWERPRVLWSGVDSGADALRAAARKLASKLETEGFRAEDREFMPHITLGRVRSRRGLPALLERAAPWRLARAWAGTEFDLAGFCLMRSRLTPERALHECLAFFGRPQEADA